MGKLKFNKKERLDIYEEARRIANRRTDIEVFGMCDLLRMSVTNIHGSYIGNYTACNYNKLPELLPEFGLFMPIIKEREEEGTTLSPFWWNKGDWKTRMNALEFMINMVK